MACLHRSLEQRTLTKQHCLFNIAALLAFYGILLHDNCQFTLFPFIRLECVDNLATLYMYMYIYIYVYNT